MRMGSASEKNLTKEGSPGLSWEEALVKKYERR